MHILGLIPARLNSKGIPRKSLAPLAGRPLVEYTFEAARASRALTRVVVSTDDPDVADRVGYCIERAGPFVSCLCLVWSNSAEGPSPLRFCRVHWSSVTGLP